VFLLVKDFEYTIVEPPKNPELVPAPYEGDVFKHQEVDESAVDTDSIIKHAMFVFKWLRYMIND